MGRTANKAVDNVRKLMGVSNPDTPEARAPKTGAQAVAKGMAQSPNTTLNNVDEVLPLDIVRNLVYSGAPEDLAQLRQIVDGLSPQGRSNLLRSISRETRNPQAPAVDAKGKALPIQLSEEGNMLVDAVFNGKDPDPSWIANKPVTPGGGTQLGGINAEADLEPKTFRPERKSDDSRDLNDRTRFRSNESIKEDKDGNLRVKHTDIQLDGQTQRAIDRAEEGLPVGPIYDDAANTPGHLKKPGRALAAGTTTPKQEATKLMHRLAETSNAHGVIDSKRADDPLMYSTADARQDNPSAFAPGNTGSKMKRHVATVRPADHSDALRAFQTVKRGEFSTPNQQFASAEDFARSFVESADQEGLNVTPITARERAEATDLLTDYNHDPALPVDRINGEDIPPGVMSEKQAGPLVRQNMSDTVRATKTAERSIMQEQTIAALARKFDDIFGHQGWGENYKPSTRPGTSEPAAPAGGVGDGVSTTQDPARVPDLGNPNQLGTPDVDTRPFDERMTSYEQEKDDALRVISKGDPKNGTGYFDPSQPLVTTPQKPKAPLGSGKPGMEIGEDVDADDLADLHQQRVGSDGEPISTEEVEPNFARGRDLGDRTGMGRTKTKELPGNKPGEYQDKQPFAAYNRENRMVSDSDLERRRKFQEEFDRTLSLGGETERSSTLRQQLRALLESNEPEAPGTSAAAAKASQIAELQRRLTLAERLDSMSGVNSMRQNDPEVGNVTQPFNPFPTPQTGGELIPVPSTTADLQGGKLAASTTPIEADEVLPPRKDFDLNDEPIEAEFELKQDAPVTPDPTTAPKVPDADPIQLPLPKEPEPRWKRWAKRAGLVGGALGIRELLVRGGQPPPGGQPPTGVSHGDPPPPGNIPPMSPPGPEGYVPPLNFGDGQGSGDIGAKPEDRIRALRNFQMNLNPNTQTLQNWTN